MASQINVWRLEHENFRRLLDLLESQIGLFHEGARPNYDLMLDIVYYLRHYPDTFHHPKEDAAIERLAKRDPAAREVARRLAGEHEIISRSGKQLLEQLNGVVSGALLPREEVEAPAATYVAYYRQHMVREESDVFPRAERQLAKEDWAAVEAAIPETPDPLFGGDVEERYRQLYRHIAVEASDASG